MRTRTRVFGMILAVGLHAAGAGAQDGGTAEAPFFTTESTTVWLDRTQVVAFRVPAPAPAARVFEARVEDPEVLEVVRAPEVLAGEEIGFVRVAGKLEGETRLWVGAAPLCVRVERPSGEARVNRPRARLTGIVPGAVVWGRFELGAEVGCGALGAAASGIDVRLHVAGVEPIAPLKELSADGGPTRCFVFAVDADALAPGPASLELVVASAAGELARSSAVRIVVAHPASEDVVAGECEDSIDAERPDGYPQGVPLVGSAADASGGAFVASERVDPPWLARREVAEAGTYQMMLVARGEYGAGAFPSAGLLVDDPRYPLTAGRLFDSSWRRVALGYPVRLDAGERVISLRLLNDVRVPGTSDRSLYLDRFELLRVDAATEDAGATMGDAADPAEGAEPADDGLWVAFERPLEQQPINGALRIAGHCRWSDAERTPAPHVSLVLNGRVVAEQQAAEPLFALDRAAFEPGENRLQLRARLADGRRAETPLQTVLASEPEGAEPRATLRFSVVDERWSEGMRAARTDRGQAPGHSIASLDTAGAGGELDLSEELEGELDVVLQARGPSWPESTWALVRVVPLEGEPVETRVRVRGYWNLHAGETIALPPGPKKLVVQRAESPGAGDEARLELRSVLLRAHAAGEDRCAPRAVIRYPAPGHLAHGVDAVVVEAWDDERLQLGDVLVDGRPQRTYGHVREGFGYVVLPLVLRGVEPGEHTLRVRVADRAGNVGESQDVPFVVLAEEPAQRGTYARAVHLLDRLAFGPAPDELAELLLSGERAWLERRLGPLGPGEVAAIEAADVINHDRSQNSVTRGVLHGALRSPNPLRARFTLWVENHFSTWMQKAQPGPEWREHLAFQRLGTAPFAELLWTSATSSAMLHYLDQARSYAGQLNENYAREIMELHTVGVDGGYTQEDVTSLAGLLAGLTLADEGHLDGSGRYLRREFRFDPDLGDGRPRRILGMQFAAAPRTARFDRVRLALELLSAHPSTARFVARKLAEHYVSVPAPESLVEDLARTFMESGGDTSAVLLALAVHEAFWDPALPQRVATPLDFGVRLARTTDAYEIDWAVRDYMARSGMGVFDRATPDGYPEEDAAWVDTNATMQRWNLAQQVSWAVRRLVAPQLNQRAGGDVDAWRQRVVDVAAVRLTGSTLSEESNRAALEYMASADVDPGQEVQQLTVLLCQLPEASLR